VSDVIVGGAGPTGLTLACGLQAAGVDVAFEPWGHGFHVWPVFISAGLPESAAAVERVATFFKAEGH